ncbi:MAG: hypothetical protein Q7J06_00100 [Bacteroidales bacterium]|nr:hypothetical protein [Bacteroidales bacterium]
MTPKITKRPDGRANDELREMKAKTGIVKNADGSAMFSFGNTVAIAAVYGPRKLLPQHLQNPEKGKLRCYYDLASFSVTERKKPGPSRRSSEISFVTGKALEPVIRLDNYPNTVIDVYILVLQADASTRCAGINAAAMALANAGIPMDEMVTSVSIGKMGDIIVADLTKEEEDFTIEKNGKEEKAATDIPIAVLSRSKKISLLQLDGKCTKEDVKEAIQLAKKVSSKINQVQMEALKKVK